MIKAIIFDFDGLIVDTESPAYEAFKAVYEEYGEELPFADYAKCIGTSFQYFDPYTDLSARADVNKETIRKKFQTVYAKLLERVELRPGVIDYLESAKRSDLKIGLASSSPLAWIEPYFKKFGLLPYFETLQTADVVKKVKPDPELYLRAMAALGVSGDQAIAFEDSLNGLKAAKTAGLHCVAVPNEATKQFIFADADLQIPSMADRPLADIVRMFDEKGIVK